MQQYRPTVRELLKKLEEAKAYLRKPQGRLVNPSKVVSELYVLEAGDTEKVWNLILVLLDEIHPEDYVGGRPPQKSYERSIEGKDLFAFCWWSKKLGKKMYIKYVLHDEHYVYVSLHESKGAK